MPGGLGWLRRRKRDGDAQPTPAETPSTWDPTAKDQSLDRQRERDVEMYRRKLETAPNSMVLWIKLGRALFQLNRWDEALDAWDHWAALNPDDSGP